MGENGAGKSTLLNVLGGVLGAGEGTMRLEGAPYAPASPSEATARGVAFVHQELNLFPNLSVAENVFLHALPRRGPLVDRARLEARTREPCSARWGSTSRPATLVEDLAPGERQLVEIVKALAIEARVMILDEPTTSLSAPEAERLFAIVESLRAQGLGVIYVSHALGDVLRLSDDVVVLRDGAVVGGGPRAEFDEARLVSLMVGREIETVFPTRRAAPTGEVALEARGRLAGRAAPATSASPSTAARSWASPGLMGAGRTETLRALFGLDPLGRARCSWRAGRLPPSAPAPRSPAAWRFVTEDRRQDGLLLDAPVADNLALVALPVPGVARPPAPGARPRRAAARAGRGRARWSRPPAFALRRAASPAATSRRSSSASG